MTPEEEKLHFPKPRVGMLSIKLLTDVPLLIALDTAIDWADYPVAITLSPTTWEQVRKALIDSGGVTQTTITHYNSLPVALMPALQDGWVLVEAKGPPVTQVGEIP